MTAFNKEAIENSLAITILFYEKNGRLVVEVARAGVSPSEKIYKIADAYDFVISTVGKEVMRREEKAIQIDVKGLETYSMECAQTALDHLLSEGGAK